MEKKVIYKVGLAHFKDNKVIMVKSDTSGEAYYFLGGTVEQGESDMECLVREVKEEANIQVDTKTIKFLKEFIASAHNRVNTDVVLRLYAGEIIGIPTPSSEILDIQYFDASQGKTNPPLLSGMVFGWLEDHGYVR